MATFLGNTVQFKVGSTDLSAYVSSVTISQEFDQLEVTRMGSTGHEFIAGLENSSISVEFNADFAASAVNQTINGSTDGNGLIGTTAAIKVVPQSGAVAASNPLYSFSCLITQWPQAYNVGELATVSVTWPVSGKITKTITGTF
jgi:hypothetical protein